MNRDQFPLALKLMVDLGIALKITPLNKQPACWEHQVDERWWFAMNGHREEMQTSEGDPVKPFTAYIKYNGWPAGILDFGGGIIAAGEGANENTFIAALEAKVSKVQGFT